jgi:DNA-binding SARP family transcriptional activator
VETGVESVASLQLRLLGPLTLVRAGAPLALPPSRKVRALIAYLALAPHAVARSHLCELLWDLPNDPRGELRWCLSKVRALLDELHHTRVVAEGEALRLDLADVPVDALELNTALQAGIAALPVERLRALSALAGGEFLQGLEIGRSAPWSAWLIGHRRRYRAAQAALLEHLARALEPGCDEALACLEQWLQLAPFDRRAHELMLDALARRGRLREGDEHLDAAARLFEAEAQDWAPLGRAWREAKQRHSGAIGTEAASIIVVAADAPPSAAPAATHRRASIAVMPFADPAHGVALRGSVADGLAFDVITRLAKLRSLFVIAPGTMFALDARGIGADEAGRTLNVDYVASGSVRREPERMAVTVQLAETRSARIVWADVFNAAPGDATFAVLDQIGDRIVASIASQIETAERNRAILKAPNSLDAWEAHHRGLWHMVRFNREDNEQARHFFETALHLDPGFARPYAGLSFTHFQDAFLGWDERGHAVERAYAIASQGLMADELDPATHWAMGRALWLRGRVDDSLAEIDTSIELSPNFAHAHYTRGFIHSQSGDALAAIASADHSRELSPFDPLVFAMLGARAIALMRLGRHDEAADWAMKATLRPNAHVHILGIAAHCLALAERTDEARAVVAQIHRQLPGYRSEDFLAAFRFSEDATSKMLGVAPRIGMG